MKTQFLSIGQLSRRSGIPVRRLRFYEDQGLFPGSDRAASGYRLFTDADVIRADTIRLLRDSGMSLKAIKASLGRSLDLKELLKLRLNEINATVSSLALVANAIRSAIDTDEISQSDIRRISEMMTLSIDARAEAIRHFVEAVESDPETSSNFKNTIRSLFPDNLPDDATAEQREAWMALSDELRNPQVLHDVLESGRRYRTPLEPKEYFKLIMSFRERAMLLMSRDLAPTSPEAGALAKEFVEASATHYGCSAEDSDFLRYLRENWNPSGLSRYYVLALKLRNTGPIGSISPGTKWLHSAVMAYLGASETPPVGS